MIENQNIRQILAIMVTDIADYTETMNNDEEKAWEYLKKQRALIPPMISKMNGHMFKEMGDGTFSKFKSAIDAVQCAVKIQQEASSNELPIRIAVHLGDVMDDGVDVIGTGVNIASRINSFANTGNIVVSEDVWRQIRNQSDMEGRSIGAQDIKGYHQTVEVFELTYNPDGSVIKKVKVTETVTVTDEEGKEVQTETAKKEFIKKVAIFPFDYTADDEKYEFLKYGLPFGCCVSLLQDPLIEIEFPNEEILDGENFITKLRNSGYEKGENVPLPLKKKIAKELHCDYFIFGIINTKENNLEINSKVYSSQNGKLLNENNTNGNDYFQLIDDLAEDFRNNIGVPNLHIDEIENLPITDITTQSHEAYKQYIKATVQVEHENDYETAYKLLLDATTKDPTFSLANFSLYWICFLSNNEEYQQNMNKGINNAISHLYKLPPRLAFLIKLFNFMMSRGEPDKAEKVVQMWIRQFPESLSPYKKLGWIYERHGRKEDAINVYKDIIVKDPEYYNAYLALQRLYRESEDYEKALQNAEIYMKYCPAEAVSYVVIGDIYSHKGDEVSAKDYYEQALMIESNNSNYMVKIAETELYLGNFNEAEEQLEDALTFCKTNQDYYNAYNSKANYCNRCGKINATIKNNEKANTYLEKFNNPIDSVLNRIFRLSNYVYIGQSEIAIKKLQEGEAKLVHPFNLLTGLGELFIGDKSGNMNMVKSGTDKMKRFLKEKDFPWLRKFPDFGRAILLMHEKKDYDTAIQIFEDISNFYTDMKHEWTNYIIKCYNGKKDYDSAINIGKKYLEVNPLSPLIILEVSKAYQGNNDTDKAKEYITKLLGIWEDADEEYIYFQEAKKLWKELNIKMEPA